MNFPTDTVLIVLSSGVASLIAFVVATRAASTSRRLETAQVTYNRAQVDAEAYDRAKSLYESAITLSRTEVADLREEIGRLKAELREVSLQLRDIQRDRIQRGLPAFESVKQQPPSHHPPPHGSESHSHD